MWPLEGRGSSLVEGRNPLHDGVDSVKSNAVVIYTHTHTHTESLLPTRKLIDPRFLSSPSDTILCVLTEEEKTERELALNFSLPPFESSSACLPVPPMQ